MTTVLITGSEGFIGKNLAVALRRTGLYDVLCFDTHVPPSELPALLSRTDFVFHLAGVNRPPDESAFRAGNTELTRSVLDARAAVGRPIPVLLTSSTQAALGNPYGTSKRAAEELVFARAAQEGFPAYVFRLPGVFGKWCRPHYNSVVATFCHQIARGLPIVVSEPDKELELVYIDDVVHEFRRILDERPAINPGAFCPAPRSFRIRVGELARQLHMFRDIRATLALPDLQDDLTRYLYATYLSYLDTCDFAYALAQRADQRGALAEMLKSPHFGQIFVSRTRPGFIRGNHYHDTKIEKFIVVAGTARIRFLPVLGGQPIEYVVRGEDMKIVDIPPGYAHAIENTGEQDLVVLFWASEVFDRAAPDTNPQETR